MSKLNPLDVLQIRTLYDRGTMTQYELAERYEVSQPTIGELVRNEIHQDVGGPTVDNGKGKLNRDQVDEIRQRNDNGETYASISRDYPVSAQQVSRICKGENWETRNDTDNRQSYLSRKYGG